MSHFPPYHLPAPLHARRWGSTAASNIKNDPRSGKVYDTCPLWEETEKDGVLQVFPNMESLGQEHQGRLSSDINFELYLRVCKLGK